MAPRELAPLPAPSPSLAERALPVYAFSGGLYRIHQTADDPEFWGRTGTNRFDAPNGEFGVLYAAEGFNGAFIESFGDAPHILSVNSLTVRGIAHAQTLRPLQLVDLAGPGLSQLALDARIYAGDHALPQQWSHALWAHPQHVDGLWYVARHDGNQRSAALFDRAASAIQIARRGGLLDAQNRATTAAALDAYGFAVLP